MHVQYFTWYNDIHMGHIQMIVAFLYIIWQIRVLPGTPHIFKRVFMGTLVLLRHRAFYYTQFKSWQKVENFEKNSKIVKNLGTCDGRYLQVLPNTDRYFF